jgi:hypothetical protein
VYPVIADPPSVAGAVHDTTAAPFPPSPPHASAPWNRPRRQSGITVAPKEYVRLTG